MASSSSSVALVVGARTELSRIIADGLCDLGYSLVVEEGDEPNNAASEHNGGVRAIIKRGGQAIVGHHDTTTHSGAEAAVSLTTKTFGAVDVVIVVGELCSERAFLRIEANSWSTLIAHHLTTTFFTCQAAAAWMVEHQRTGRLICLTGSDGAVTTDFGRVHLAGVMGGIFSLTRAMAVELRPKGITVNAIAPSLTPPLEKGAPPGHAAPRYATRDVIPMIDFLVSGKASEITGQVIGIDGRKLSVIRPVKSAGAMPEGQQWTSEEISRRWGELSR